MIKCLLLGPCGVGKSTLGISLAEFFHLEFIDLDHYIENTYHIHNLADYLGQSDVSDFYQASLFCLNKIHLCKAHSIVSVGAGTQYAAQSQLDLLVYPSLCLWAEPDYLWRKNQLLRSDPREFEYFKDIEFNTFRQILYQKSMFFLDVTKLNQKETFLKALDPLKRMI